jgi:hypothetical protein
MEMSGKMMTIFIAIVILGMVINGPMPNVMVGE